MPVMNKMRDSMPVVFAALAGIFLLMIIFEWGGQGMLFNKGGDAETLGVVNDTKITRKDYQRISEAVTQNFKQEKKKNDLTEEEQAQIEDQTWDEAVTDALIRQSITRMGITVTDQDVRDNLFENPPPYLKQQFTDSLGQFHADIYVKELKNPKNDSIVRNIESQLRESLLRQKWQEVMYSTIRITDNELAERFGNENSKASVQVLKFVPTPMDLQAAEKQVTDADVQKYYDAHPWDYKTEEQRKFKFVIFQQQASARDTAMALEHANTVKRRLEQAPADKVDTLAQELAADYSEMPAQPSHVLEPKQFGRVDVNTLKVGDVIVLPGQTGLTVNRVTGTLDTAEPAFHIQHIVISSGGRGHATNMDSAKAAAEKIFGTVTAANFSEMARQYSADPRSAGSGGDMGWVTQRQLPPPVANAAETAQLNQPHAPIETPAGYEIMLLTGRTRRAIVVTSVPLDIKPSGQTVNMQKQQASMFQQQAVKQGFDAAAKAAGYNVIGQAPPASKKGAPIFGSREFIDWIFAAAKGDVSPPIKVTAVRGTIVAQLVDVTPAGQKPLDAVKAEIKPKVAKVKAIAQMVEKAKAIRSRIPANADFATVGSQLGDTTLHPVVAAMGPAESVNGIPSSDYAVNNTAYSMKPGQISDAVKGAEAAYIIKLVNLQPANPQAFQAQKATLLKTLINEKQQRFFQAWLQNMKDNANIVDYRTAH